MPIKVGGALDTANPVDITRGSVDGSSNASAFAGVAEAAAVGAQNYVKYKEQKTLGALAGEAQGIVSEAAGFQAAKDGLVEKMAEADRPTFNMIAGQMARLRNGEVQGVLSPQAANMRLQSLAKSYINRYPRMAGDIRKILAQVSGDITPETTTDKITDPVLKARYELVEEATKRGVSVQEVVQLNRTKDERDMIQAQFDKARTQGSMDVPVLMHQLIDAQATDTMAQMTSGVISRIKSGQFVRENELTGLRTTMTQGLAALNQELTRFEIEHGVVVDHKVFEDRYKGAFEPLIALASEADSLDKQKRFVDSQEKIMKFADYKYWHNMVGAFTPIVMSSPESAYTVLGDMSDMAEKVKKGQLSSLEQAAIYDPKTRALLDSLKGNGEKWKELMGEADKMLTGKTIDPRTPDAEKSLTAAIVLNTAASDKEGKVLANYILSEAPIEGVLRNSRTHPVLRQSTAAQGALEAQADRYLVSVISSTPLEQLAKIQINPNGDEMFTHPGIKGERGGLSIPVSGREGAGLKGGAAGRVTSENDKLPLSFVTRLNNYFQLMKLYKDPTEASVEMHTKWQNLIRRRIENDAQIAQSLAGTDEQGNVTGVGSDPNRSVEVTESSGTDGKKSKKVKISGASDEEVSTLAGTGGDK